MEVFCPKKLVLLLVFVCVRVCLSLCECVFLFLCVCVCVCVCLGLGLGVTVPLCLYHSHFKSRKVILGGGGVIKVFLSIKKWTMFTVSLFMYKTRSERWFCSKPIFGPYPGPFPNSKSAANHRKLKFRFPYTSSETFSHTTFSMFFLAWDEDFVNARTTINKQ